MALMAPDILLVGVSERFCFFVFDPLSTVFGVRDDDAECFLSNDWAKSEIYPSS